MCAFPSCLEVSRTRKADPSRKCRRDTMVLVRLRFDTYPHCPVICGVCAGLIRGDANTLLWQCSGEHPDEDDAGHYAICTTCIPPQHVRPPFPQPPHAQRGLVGQETPAGHVPFPTDPPPADAPRLTPVPPCMSLYPPPQVGQGREARICLG